MNSRHEKIMRFNPFRPNSIVAPGMFSGRFEETEAIQRSLNQTKNGNPRHFLLEGERGIGKSSLMLVASALAMEKADSEEKKGFDFLTVEVELNDAITYLGMIRAIAMALRTQLRQREHLRTLASMTWDFLSKWSVLGVEYKGEAAPITPPEAIDELANTLATFLKDVGKNLDGVLLLIDEADKADPQSANLGEFVKLLTEKLTKLRCERVCIGIAGLPVLLSKLKQGHESSLRIFETFMLEPLSDDESKDVIRRALALTKDTNGEQTTITDDALNVIAHLAEGYPHFIQQFAFCAFERDTDNVIDVDDVLHGAYSENGALDQLGRKYFQQLYFDSVSSPDYRKVLNVMAEYMDKWVSRQTIIREIDIKETQVNNALSALKARNIILVNEEKKGEYRLPTRSFAVWIKAVNEKRKLIENRGEEPTML